MFRTLILLTSFLFCVLQPSVAKSVDGSGWKSKSAASSHCCCGCVGECKCGCEKKTVQEKSSSEIPRAPSQASKVHVKENGTCHCRSSNDSNVPVSTLPILFEYCPSQVAVEVSIPDLCLISHDIFIASLHASSGFSPPGKFCLIPLRI